MVTGARLAQLTASAVGFTHPPGHPTQSNAHLPPLLREAALGARSLQRLTAARSQPRTTRGFILWLSVLCPLPGRCVLAHTPSCRAPPLPRHHRGLRTASTSFAVTFRHCASIEQGLEKQSEHVSNYWALVSAKERGRLVEVTMGGLFRTFGEGTATTARLEFYQEFPAHSSTLSDSLAKMLKKTTKHLQTNTKLEQNSLASSKHVFPI